jgi:hypothetical protein
MIVTAVFPILDLVHDHDAARVALDVAWMRGPGAHPAAERREGHAREQAGDGPTNIQGVHARQLRNARASSRHSMA